MIITIVSFILGLILLVVSFFLNEILLKSYLDILLITTGSVFILINVLMQVLVLPSIQRMGTSFSSRVLELYSKDHFLYLTSLFLFCFSLTSFLLTIFLSWHLPESLLFFILINVIAFLWMVFLGISLDLTLLYFKKVRRYLDPFSLLKMFSDESLQFLKKKESMQACRSMDTLTEIAIKSLPTAQISLCCAAADEIVGIIDQAISFFMSNKEKKEEANTQEEIHFILFYALQQLEQINSKALSTQWDRVCSHLISVIGRLAIIAAQHSLSLSSLPLHFLGKITQSALEEGMKEVPVKATCTLVEVAKTIATDTSIDQTDISPPFLSIISQLEKNSKEIFTKDKSTDIKVLKQPFLELKETLQKSRYNSHPELNTLIRDIDRILDEYTALQQILRTIPPK